MQAQEIQTQEQAKKNIKVMAVNAITNSAMESQADKTPITFMRPRVIRAD